MSSQENRTIVASQAELRQLIQEENQKVVDQLLAIASPKEPKTLNAKQAAEYLGISLSTLYKNVDRIPHRKFGKKLVFVAKDLDGFDQNTARQEQKAIGHGYGSRAQQLSIMEDQRH